jgi:hypothetical protein
MNPLEKKHEKELAINEIQESFNNTQKELTQQIEVSSWLRVGHPLGIIQNLSFKQGALILGDGTIQGTPFEGSDSTSILTFYCDILENITNEAQNNPNKYPLQNRFSQEHSLVVNGLKQALRISKEIDSLEEGGHKLKEESKKLNLINQGVNTLIKEFQTDQTLWIHSGWVDKNGSAHGLMLILDGKSERLFVVNTGSGLESYHPSATFPKINSLTGEIEEETRSQQFVSYKIPRKQLTNKEFFQVLVEIQIRYCWDGTLEFDSSAIYEPIIHLLGGTREYGLDPNTYPLAYKKDQRSGTCGPKSITTTLYYVLLGCLGLERGFSYRPEGVDCYKLDKFLWQSQTLVSMAHNHPKPNPLEKLFFEEFIENISRSTSKESLKITEENAAEFTITLEDIRSKVLQTPEQIDFSSPIIIGKYEPLVQSNEKTLIHGKRKLNTQANSENKNLDLKTKKNLKQICQIANEPLNGDLQKIITNLSRLLSIIPKDFSIPDVIDRVKPFILNLPTPSNSPDCLWRNCNPETILELMGKFSSLLDRLFNTQLVHSPDDTVILYSIYAIQVQLARSHADSLLDNMPVYWEDLIFEARFPHFILTNGGMQKRLLELFHFFNPQFKLTNLTSIPSLQHLEKILFSFKTPHSQGAYRPFSIKLIQKRDNEIETNNNMIFYEKHFKKIMENDQKKIKLYGKKKFPGRGDLLTPKCSRLEHLGAIVLEEFDKNSVLPPSVHLLRRTAALLDDYHYSYNNRKGKLFTQYIHSEKVLEFFNNNNEIVPCDISCHSQLYKTVVDNPFFVHFGKFQGQNRDIDLQQIYLNQSLDVSREIEMLGNDPYQAISRCTGFIKNNFNLLKDKEIQNILFFHIFSPGRLLAQMEADPEIIVTLDHTLKQVVEGHLENYNLQSSLFYANVGITLSNFVKEIGSNLLLTNFRSIIRSSILPKLGTDEQKRHDCFEVLALSYKDSLLEAKPFNSTIAKDLLTYFLLARITGRIPKLAYAELKELNNYLLDAHSWDRDEILNFVLSVINSTDKTYQWFKTEDLLFECQSFIIDVLDSTIIDLSSKSRRTYLPPHVLGSETFRAIFKKQKIHQVELNVKNQKYTINRNLPSELTIRLIEDYNPEYSKQINQLEYTYYGSKSTLLAYNYAIFGFETYLTWINESLNPHLLVTDYDYRPVYYLPLEETLNSDKDDNSKVSDLVDDSNLFGLSGILETASRGLAWLKSSLPVSASVKSEVNSKYHIVGIQKFDENGILDKEKIRTHFRETPLPPELVDFRFLEPDPNYIECWTTEGELVEFKVPRAGYSFVVKHHKDNQKYLFSEQYPGYYLIENPRLDALNQLHFFTLENSAQDRKILIPHASIDFAFQPKGNSFKVSQILKQDEYYAEYRIKLGESQLRPQNLDSELYLLYIHIVKRDFNAAYELFKGLNPLDRMKNDPDEKVQQLKILGYIVADLIKNKHPSAQAFLLHIALFIDTNELKYPLDARSPKEELIEVEDLHKAYIRYKSNKTNTPLKLNQNKEKKLIDILFLKIDNKISTIKERWNQAPYLAMKNSLMSWHSFLKTQKFAFKVRLATIENKEWYSCYELGTLFDSFYPRIDNYKLTNFLVQDKSYFRKHFFHLYRIATIGNALEKEKLTNILKAAGQIDCPYLRLLRKVNKGGFSQLPSILTMIRNKQISLENTLLLGDREKAKEFLEKSLKSLVYHASGYDSLNRQMFSFFTRHKPSLSFKTHTQKLPPEKRKVSLDFDSKSLHEIDVSYDVYFKELVSKFFACDPIAIPSEKDLLPTDHPNKKVRDQIKSGNDELELFRASLPKERENYNLRSDVSLIGLYEELQIRSSSLSQDLKAKKAALLWKINDIPDYQDKRSFKKLRQIGFRKRLVWKDIQRMTLEGNLNTFSKKTHLNRNDALQFMQAVSEVLLISTRMQQMKTVMNEINRVNQADSRLMPDLLQKIPETLLIIRAYIPSDKTLSLQWFEFANQYHYRAIQLEKIHGIMSHDSDQLLVEMPTGAGKTKTVTATLDIQKSEEGHTVFNTFPSTLEIANAFDIKEQYAASYAKKVDRFCFDRSSELTYRSIEQLYNSLLKDKKLGRPVINRSEALRALELHTLLFLKMAWDDIHVQGNLAPTILLCLKTLKLARVEGWASIDESHITLDSIDQLIYSLGKYFTLPEEQVEIIEKICDLLTKGDLKKLLDIQNNQQIFAVDSYSTHVAPKLCLYFEKKFAIEKEQKLEFEHFVLGLTDECPSWLKQHEHKKTIYLVRGMLSEVLKSCLKGSVDENYGLSLLHIKTAEFAIPFSSANRRRETKKMPSQYKNPHVTLIKTYFTYLYKGLSCDQIIKLVDYLKTQAIKETEECGIPIHKTEAALFFNKLVTDIPLSQISNSQIEELHPKLKKIKAVIFYYIKNIIVPQIKIYPDIIVSDVHNFLSQFGSSVSFSATPQDKFAHSLDTYFMPMKGTSGQVTHLLLTKCKDPSTIHRMMKTKPAEVVEETLGILKSNPKIHATIDYSAMTKGLSNQEVSEKLRGIFKDRKDVSGIIFFEEITERFKMMDLDTGKAHYPSDISPELIYAFYDQSRCAGSDLDLALDAIGLVLTGKTGKPGQAIGRMRQLAKGQSIHVGYPDVLHNEIAGDSEIDIKKLLVYWISNDLKITEQKNYEHQLQQMANEIRRSILDQVIGVGKEEPNVSEAVYLVGKNLDIFFSKQTCDPEELYAQNQKEEETLKCLHSFQQRAQDKVKTLWGMHNEKEKIKTRLNKYPANWPTMLLPEKTKLAVSTNTECEVLQEVEVQTQTETQTQEQTDSYIPQNWSEHINLFIPGWEKPNRHLYLEVIAKEVCNSYSSKMERILTQKLKIKDRNSFLKIGLFIIASYHILLLNPDYRSTIGKIWLVAAPNLAPIVASFLYLHYANNHYRKGMLFFPVSQVIKQSARKHDRRSATFFSPNFLSSNNFFRQKDRDIYKCPQRAFEVSQKTLFSLLILKDETPQGPKYTAIAIDQNDSQFLHQKLLEDRQKVKDPSKRNRKVGIYDLANDQFISEGKNKFNQGEINHPELAKLTGQAKFLNGSLQYTEKELQQLKLHIEQVKEKVDVEVLRSFFMKTILPVHPHNFHLARIHAQNLSILKLLT